jgi:hypothetical protein
MHVRGLSAYLTAMDSVQLTFPRIQHTLHRQNKTDRDDTCGVCDSESLLQVNRVRLKSHCSPPAGSFIGNDDTHLYFSSRCACFPPAKERITLYKINVELPDNGTYIERVQDLSQNLSMAKKHGSRTQRSLIATMHIFVQLL